MSTRKSIVVRTSDELAGVLGLPEARGSEIEARVALVEQIISIVEKTKLTHAQLARAAGTSRSRLTAILNHDTRQVSTDLLLRIAATLGYRARITLVRARTAA